MKDFIKRNTTILFVTLWSLTLFVSTYLGMFRKEFWDYMDKDDVFLLTLPITLVLVLYLWEEAYNVGEHSVVPLHDLKKQFKSTFVALGLAVLCMSFIGIAHGPWKLCPLGLGWIMISRVKYITLKYNNLPIEINSHS